MLMDRRTEVEGALLSPLSDDEWRYLEEKGYTEDGEWDAETGGAAEAARVVRELRRIFSRTGGSGERVERPPRGWHEQRVRLLARVYARLAEPSVQTVRQTVSGAALRAVLTEIGEREAAEMVSGAPEPGALLPWITDQYYHAWGVAPGANGDAISAAKRHLSAGGKVQELWYSADGRVARLTVPTASPLGEVAMAAAELSEWYRWNRWDATQWVVCGGEAPLPWVLRWKPELRWGDAATTTRLVLEVDPLLSPAEVAAAYSRVRSAITLRGARLRRLDAKAQARVGFVLDQPEDGEKPPWEVWREQWNAGPGGKHGSYRGDGGGPWNFRRDMRSAVRRLTRVDWRAPWERAEGDEARPSSDDSS